MIGKFLLAFALGAAVGTGAGAGGLKAYQKRTVTSAEVIIAPQTSGGPLTLQLNLNREPVGWIMLTPTVTDYIKRNLPDAEQ